MEDTLAGHSAAYSKTLEAGRHLSESVEDLELQNRLQTELQDLEKAWNETQSRLDRGRDLVKARVQVRYQLSVLDDRIHHVKEKMSEQRTRRTREEKTGTVKKKRMITPDQIYHSDWNLVLVLF